MTLAINNEHYETRPFECAAAARELRKKHFWHTWQAQKEGELVLLGLNFYLLGYLYGFGDFANPSIGTHYTRLSRTPNAEGITHAIEAAEAYGMGRDVCGAMKAHLGQLVQGLSQTGPQGERFTYDVAFHCTTCRAMSKTVQLAAEHLNVPLFMIDIPSNGASRTNLSENRKKYVVNQLQEAIEGIEKTTGKKYDDEKLIEGVKNMWHVAVTWGKIWELFKNVPAPANMSQMQKLQGQFYYTKDGRDYVDSLYDELKYRVENKISAIGMERLRLTHENLPPLHRADVLKSPEAYGAIFVCGHPQDMSAAWLYQEDGSRVLLEEPEKRGITIKNREDALNMLVESHMRQHKVPDYFDKCETMYRRLLDYRIAAAVFHYDRPCQTEMCNTLEGRAFLQGKGIPVGVYTSSQGDPRDFDEKRVYEELDTFYESLGLTRLDFTPPVPEAGG